MTTLILSLCISFSVSFFCSLLEACALSLSLTDIAHLSEKKPLIAAIWKRFKENLEKPIAVILIVNTLAHTIGASLAGAQFDKLFGAQWIVVFSVAFSFGMIQWTELLPKSLGVRYNMQIAAWAARPLQFLIKLMHPLVALTNWLNRPFTRQPHGRGTPCRTSPC